MKLALIWTKEGPDTFGCIPDYYPLATYRVGPHFGPYRAWHDWDEFHENLNVIGDYATWEEAIMAAEQHYLNTVKA